MLKIFSYCFSCVAYSFFTQGTGTLICPLVFLFLHDFVNSMKRENFLSHLSGNKASVQGKLQHMKDLVTLLVLISAGWMPNQWAQFYSLISSFAHQFTFNKFIPILVVPKGIEFLACFGLKGCILIFC